jgi:hypothetical protein
MSSPWPGADIPFSVNWTQTGYLVEGVKIDVLAGSYSTDSTFPSIDAVQLSGSFDPNANGSHSDQYATTVIPNTVIGPSSGNIPNNSQITNYAYTDSWAVAKVLCPPDVPSYGDDGRAWLAFPQYGADLSITLGFAIPVYADGVTIRENSGNGFVTQIDVVDMNNQLHTVWSGMDPTQPGALADFSVNWAQTSYQVQGVRIYVNTNHNPYEYPEIDSVQLHGWFTPGTLVASGSGSLSASGATPNLPFTPDDAGTFVATLTASDPDGAAVARQVIDVADVPPTAQITNPTVNSTTVGFTLTALEASTVDQNEGFTFSINWGDGSALQTYGPGLSTLTVNHFYAAGSYIVQVTALDMDGTLSAPATAVVVVSTAHADNITLSGGGSPNQVSVTGAAGSLTSATATDLVLAAGTGGSDTYTVYFGSTLSTPITIVGSGTDTLTVHGSADPNTPNLLNKNPGSGTSTITWSPSSSGPPSETVTYSGIQFVNIYGGQGPDFINDPGSQTTIYGGPRQNTIVITATTGSGVVINGGPSTSSNTYIITMGKLLGPVTINAPAGSTNAVTVNGPPGSNVLTLSSTQLTGAGETIYFYLGTPATSFMVSGGSGNNNQLVVQGTPPGPVTAQNLAPTVGAITAPVAGNPINTAIAASAGFTNLDGNSQTALWNWGDGSTSPGTVKQTGTTGSVTGSHTYTVPGVFTITLTVTDSKGGGSGTSTFQYAVVYDPSSYASGGGWITSPAGAYIATPTLTGNAFFGFAATYLPGLKTPLGSSVFVFPAANLTLRSTSFDWLVVTPTETFLHGTGTVNGTGSFGFFVAATDPDASASGIMDLRVKIWNTSTGEATGVVYDTQAGAAYTVLPSTPLGGGVVLHGNAKGLKASGTGSINSPKGADVANPMVTGPANLSFIVSYTFGAAAPTGQDFFTFPVANLSFKSTALSALTFSTSGAQLTGRGTVNGSGNYGFLLAVGDGNAVTSNGLVDVRMKIWDNSKGEKIGVIYDNQPGAADSAAPTTPLLIPQGGGGGAAPPPGPGGAAGNPRIGLSPVTPTAEPMVQLTDPADLNIGRRLRDALFAVRQPLLLADLVRELGDWVDQPARNWVR